MLQTTAPSVTRFDYEQMPDGPPYFQVIEGELVMSPSPKTSHQQILGSLYLILSRHLQEKPVGLVLLAPLDVFLGDVNVYQPDLIYVSNERRSFVTDRGIEGPPDLVVEILSPATARYDRGFKRKVYARTGVQELWLIDPETKLIQVYRLTEDAETPVATLGANAILETALLPGLRVDTAAVFRSSLGS
jgi:Uma2 family endonuclease